MDPVTFPFPDSTLVKAATQLVRTVSPPFLFNHCTRTYLFAEMH
jgi:hypothetical protein